MLQIQGIEGEAVVNYCESMITQGMGYYWLPRIANKMGIINPILCGKSKQIIGVTKLCLLAIHTT
jgi:hypothetical protein